MILASRDPFGFGRVYYDIEGRAHAASLSALLARLPDLSRALDAQGIAAHIDRVAHPDRTVLGAVRCLPPGHALYVAPGGMEAKPHHHPPRAGDLRSLLLAALTRAISDGQRTAVVLSGGLDSALVLALVRRLGHAVPVYVLDVDLDGYGERETALRTANSLGIDAQLERATGDDFVEALPDAIAFSETPLYNLHPVGRLLLARALRRDGIDVALSGDGADQVMRRDRSADYLPICKSLFDAAGVKLCSPFLDEAVVSHLMSLPPDPEKRALREIAAELPIPRELVQGPKLSRLAPPIDLSALVGDEEIGALTRRLGRPVPRLGSNRERVEWTTLVLLLRALGAWP